MIVDLTYEEVTAIIGAIMIAENEGYGPEKFGEGTWKPILDKLIEVHNEN